MRGYQRLLAVGLALAFCLAPATALGAGTGDAKSDVVAKPTKVDRSVERAYQAWKAKRPVTVSGGVSATAITEAPYQYFYTPTHQQETSYWCGPATAQTIDDYWGSTISQSAIAGMLGTTQAGTWFPALAPVITQLTGVQYAISGKCATNGDVYSRIQYGLLARRHPAAADVYIYGSVWDYYVRNHSGHIIPVEAFDWRNMTVRINDPYNEATSTGGGGPTLGHKTYPASQIAHGVLSHAQKVLVY